MERLPWHSARWHCHDRNGALSPELHVPLPLLAASHNSDSALNLRDLVLQGFDSFFYWLFRFDYGRLEDLGH